MDSNQQNHEAWDTGTYQAWVARFGLPREAARKLRADPVKRIGRLYPFFGGLIKGKRIINLLGSNGNKAIALALLGAEAAVVDFSTENKRYAMELAREAGVELRYILSDVLQLPEEELNGAYDFVLMENGILHYFQDLLPLFAVVVRLLNQGGTMILQDFHPISTKLISSRGTTANIRKHKVTGDYFDASLEEKTVAYSKFLECGDPIQKTHSVWLRKWTLGEIVTAAASAGLCIKVLEELPNLSSEAFDKGIPKTFILVAEKR